MMFRAASTSTSTPRRRCRKMLLLFALYAASPGCVRGAVDGSATIDLAERSFMETLFGGFKAPPPGGYKPPPTSKKAEATEAPVLSGALSSSSPPTPVLEVEKSELPAPPVHDASQNNAVAAASSDSLPEGVSPVPDQGREADAKKNPAAAADVVKKDKTETEGAAATKEVNKGKAADTIKDGKVVKAAGAAAAEKEKAVTGGGGSSDTSSKAVAAKADSAEKNKQLEQQQKIVHELREEQKKETSAAFHAAKAALRSIEQQIAIARAEEKSTLKEAKKGEEEAKKKIKTDLKAEKKKAKEFEKTAAAQASAIAATAEDKIQSVWRQLEKNTSMTIPPVGQVATQDEKQTAPAAAGPPGAGADAKAGLLGSGGSGSATAVGAGEGADTGLDVLTLAEMKRMQDEQQASLSHIPDFVKQYLPAGVWERIKKRETKKAVAEEKKLDDEHQKAEAADEKAKATAAPAPPAGAVTGTAPSGPAAGGPPATGAARPASGSGDAVAAEVEDEDVAAPATFNSMAAASGRAPTATPASPSSSTKPFSFVPAANNGAASKKVITLFAKVVDFEKQKEAAADWASRSRDVVAERFDKEKDEGEKTAEAMEQAAEQQAEKLEEGAEHEAEKKEEEAEAREEKLMTKLERLREAAQQKVEKLAAKVNALNEGDRRGNEAEEVKKMADTSDGAAPVSPVFGVPGAAAEPEALATSTAFPQQARHRLRHDVVNIGISGAGTSSSTTRTRTASGVEVPVASERLQMIQESEEQQKRGNVVATTTAATTPVAGLFNTVSKGITGLLNTEASMPPAVAHDLPKVVPGMGKLHTEPAGMPATVADTLAKSAVGSRSLSPLEGVVSGGFLGRNGKSPFVPRNNVGGGEKMQFEMNTGGNKGVKMLPTESDETAVSTSMFAKINDELAKKLPSATTILAELTQNAMKMPTTKDDDAAEAEANRKMGEKVKRVADSVLQKLGLGPVVNTAASAIEDIAAEQQKAQKYEKEADKLDVATAAAREKEARADAALKKLMSPAGGAAAAAAAGGPGALVQLNALETQLLGLKLIEMAEQKAEDAEQKDQNPAAEPMKFFSKFVSADVNAGLVGIIAQGKHAIEKAEKQQTVWEADRDARAQSKLDVAQKAAQAAEAKLAAAREQKAAAAVSPPAPVSAAGTSGAAGTTSGAPASAPAVPPEGPSATSAAAAQTASSSLLGGLFGGAGGPGGGTTISQLMLDENKNASEDETRERAQMLNLADAGEDKGRMKIEKTFEPLSSYIVPIVKKAKAVIASASAPPAGAENANAGTTTSAVPFYSVPAAVTDVLTNNPVVASVKETGQKILQERYMTPPNKARLEKQNLNILGDAKELAAAQQKLFEISSFIPDGANSFSSSFIPAGVVKNFQLQDKIQSRRQGQHFENAFVVPGMTVPDVRFDCEDIPATAGTSTSRSGLLLAELAAPSAATSTSARGGGGGGNGESFQLDFDSQFTRVPRQAYEQILLQLFSNGLLQLAEAGGCFVARKSILFCSKNVFLPEQEVETIQDKALRAIRQQSDADTKKADKEVHDFLDLPKGWDQHLPPGLQKMKMAFAGLRKQYKDQEPEQEVHFLNLFVPVDQKNSDYYMLTVRPHPAPTTVVLGNRFLHLLAASSSAAALGEGRGVREHRHGPAVQTQIEILEKVRAVPRTALAAFFLVALLLLKVMMRSKPKARAEDVSENYEYRYVRF